MSSSSSSKCTSFIQKRDACRQKRGDKDDKCCQISYKAKRCLSFEHCLEEAKPYYGEDNGGIKLICSAFDESVCFGNPRVMNIDTSKSTEDRTRVFQYHEKAKRRVGNNRQKHRECNELSERLRRCLQKKQVDL
jgi:hypothetical protein